jgi:hypothetical protein
VTYPNKPSMGNNTQHRGALNRSLGDSHGEVLVRRADWVVDGIKGPGVQGVAKDRGRWVAEFLGRAGLQADCEADVYVAALCALCMKIGVRAWRFTGQCDGFQSRSLQGACMCKVVGG